MIKKEKFKYSYGRQANKTLPDIEVRLPVDANGQPDFKFMSNFMKSLPYGDRLEDSIARIKASYKEVAIVKMADRLNNLMIRPKNWNDDKWNNYLMLSKYLVNNLASANKYLAFKLDEKILNYRNNTVGR